MYGYVYLTENLVNGKCYIGQHKSTMFDIYYKGSGKYLKKAFKKYGKENFVTTIIEECDNKEKLSEREIYWIEKCGAINSLYFYNVQLGGQGHEQTKETKELLKKNNSRYWKGKHRSEETKEKLRKARTNQTSPFKGHHHSDESKKKSSIAHLGKKGWNKGITPPKEQIERQRLQILGRVCLTNGVVNKIVKREDIPYYLSIGFMKGKTLNRENIVTTNIRVFCVESNKKYSSLTAASKDIGYSDYLIKRSCDSGNVLKGTNMHFKYLLH